MTVLPLRLRRSLAELSHPGHHLRRMPIQIQHHPSRPPSQPNLCRPVSSSQIRQPPHPRAWRWLERPQALEEGSRLTSALSTEGGCWRSDHVTRAVARTRSASLPRLVAEHPQDMFHRRAGCIPATLRCGERSGRESGEAGCRDYRVAAILPETPAYGPVRRNAAQRIGRINRGG